MFQQMKVLVAKADNLSSTPRTNMVEGKESTPPSCSDLYMHAISHICTCVRAHTHTINVKKKKKAIHAILLISYPKSMYPLT